MLSYGNWCGPGWSNGQKRVSVRGTAPAVDEFDETCRQHDFAYADGYNLRGADMLFARSNFGKGATRTLAAMAVGLQGLTRPFDKLHPQSSQEIIPMTKNTSKLPQAAKSGNLRGSKPSPAKAINKAGSTTLMAPASVGTEFRASKPKIRRGTDTCTMSGRDFIGTVEGKGTATFGLGKDALLSPAYFTGTMLGNIARSYERYRWNKLRIHYVPKVPTSVTGQVIMTSQRSVAEPCLSPESGTFLQRAMSQGNAVFGPLWVSTYIDIDCSNDFMNLDAAISSDLDDAIHEELQVFTQVDVSQQVGYLFAEYDVTFKEPLFAPHANTFPYPTGPGVRCVLQANNAVNAVTDAVLFVETTTALSIPSTPNGTIFRGVFDIQGSAIATGTTFSNAFNVLTVGRGALGVSTINNSAVNFVGGTTLYFVVQGSVLDVYTSIEGAINGNGTGQLVWRTASTGAGAFAFDCALVRYGVSQISTIQ